MARNACRTCQHTWNSRGSDKPTECPSCGGTLVYVVPFSFGPFIRLALLGAVVFTVVHFWDKIGPIISDLSSPKSPPAEAVPPEDRPEPQPAAVDDQVPPVDATLKVEGDGLPAQKVEPAAPEADPVAEAERQRQLEEARKAAEAEAKRQAREKEARRVLEMGKNFESNRNNLRAVEKYREVMERFKDTAAAKEAEGLERAIVERESGS